MADSPEAALWRAVIAQAIEDASASLPDMAIKDPTPKQVKEYEGRCRYVQKLRREGRAWLTGFSKDFRQACNLAQLDPEAVRDAAMKKAAAGWPAPKASVRMSLAA